MKNYFQIPLFAIAVAIVLLVVGDSLAQSYSRPASPAAGGSSYRGGSPSQGGSSARRSFPAKGSNSTGSGSRKPLGIPSRGRSSTRSQGSNSRSRQSREALQVQEPAEPVSQEALDAIEEMNVIGSKLLAVRKRIDQLYREMPIGFDETQVEIQKQIDAGKEMTKVLERQKAEQGIKIFRLAPMREKTSIGIVLNKLSESLSPTSPESKFDPKTAMEISKLLLEQERLPVNLLMRAFKASYAVHDFEQASLILDRLEESAPVRDVYYEVLEEASQGWQDELVIRRMETATGDLPYAIVETTEGKFIIELFENQATLTVYDFVTRAENGFYDGLPFHLVRPGEFSRVGLSRKTLGPANDTISSEAQKEKARKHFAGSVTMVSEDGQTTSSVFQICHQPNVNFNGTHTVFGRVVDYKDTTEEETMSKEALDVVYNLNTIDITRFSASPREPSKIISIEIKNKRDHSYKPNASSAPTESSSASANPVRQAGDRGEESSSFDLLPQGGTQN